jgi:iron complex transport system ATP-binding protein
LKLQIKDLSFSYASSPILKDISMALACGEVLGIVGPNGSGKSTLIRCIDRILKPQNGSILLDERNIKDMSRVEIAKQLGYVPQSAPPVFPFTVFDTVLMGRRPHLGWKSSEKDLEKVTEALGLLGIEDFALRDINEISGGERQRVLLARALAQEADTLLLDEPTSNLDIRHQLEVMEILKTLVAKKGLSVIIAIHDLNLASRYADKVVMMNKGRIFAVGAPVSVFTPETIVKAYGVESVVKHEDGELYIVPKRPV